MSARILILIPFLVTKASTTAVRYAPAEKLEDGDNEGNYVLLQSPKASAPKFYLSGADYAVEKVETDRLVATVHTVLGADVEAKTATLPVEAVTALTTVLAPSGWSVSEDQTSAWSRMDAADASREARIRRDAARRSNWFVRRGEVDPSQPAQVAAPGAVPGAAPVGTADARDVLIAQLQQQLTALQTAQEMETLRRENVELTASNAELTQQLADEEAAEAAIEEHIASLTGERDEAKTLLAEKSAEVITLTELRVELEASLEAATAPAPKKAAAGGSKKRR